MTWVIDEQKRLDNERKEYKATMESKYESLPENGSSKYLINIKVPPRKEVRDSKKKPGVKYSTYEFETANGKILSVFDGLYREIITALSKHEEKLVGSDYVVIEIHNKSDIKKPNWFVTVSAGV